jgi:hypothetical protein
LRDDPEVFGGAKPAKCLLLKSLRRKNPTQIGGKYK